MFMLLTAFALGPLARAIFLEFLGDLIAAFSPTNRMLVTIEGNHSADDIGPQTATDRCLPRDFSSSDFLALIPKRHREADYSSPDRSNDN
jgi:hypothetical protein